MIVYYFYCPYCGYEDFDIFVAFSARKANGNFYLCPECNDESSNVEIGEV